MSFRPSGIYVPLVTPFDSDGQLAAGELERLAHKVIDEGAAGIVALGTTAESATLGKEERREIVRICDRVCRARGAALLVGAGSNDTAETVRALDELATTAGVAAALVVVPYYTRPSEAGVVTHFEHLAAASPLPIVIYNVPYRTGQHLGWESLTSLATHPCIVGVKQAVGSIDVDTARLFAEADDSMAILAGEDALVSPLLAMGAPGAILATANLLAAEFVDLQTLWRNGNHAAAREWGRRLVGPAEALMADPNPTGIKAALHAQGTISTPSVRLPLLCAEAPRVSVAELQRLRRELPAREPLDGLGDPLVGGGERNAHMP